MQSVPGGLEDAYMRVSPPSHRRTQNLLTAGCVLPGTQIQLWVVSAESQRCRSIHCMSRSTAGSLCTWGQVSSWALPAEVGRACRAEERPCSSAGPAAWRSEHRLPPTAVFPLSLNAQLLTAASTPCPAAARPPERGLWCRSAGSALPRRVPLGRPVALFWGGSLGQ